MRRPGMAALAKAAGVSLATVDRALKIARTRPPQVILTGPLINAQFHAGDSVPVTAEAFDPDGTVSAVEFYLANRFDGNSRSTRVARRNNARAGNNVRSSDSV